jgi:hypothetical protein
MKTRVYSSHIQIVSMAIPRVMKAMGGRLEETDVVDLIKNIKKKQSENIVELVVKIRRAISATHSSLNF